MVKKRIDWIDVTKGIAIILMIIGHTIPYSNLVVWIFSFHMPLFIILSGITSKIPEKGEMLKTNFVKYMKKLFLPYALTLLLCTAILVFKNSGFDFVVMVKETAKAFIWGNGCDYTLLGLSFKGIGPLWFLITLFFSKIAFDFINYKLKQKSSGPNSGLILYSFLMLVGIEIGTRVQLPQGFDLLFLFLFYLYVGYIFNTYNDKLKINKSILFVSAFLIWTICLGFNMHIELAVRGYPVGVLSVVESLCGSYCIIEVCKLLSKNERLMKILKKIGLISLTILCVHAIENVLIDWNGIDMNIYLLAAVRSTLDVLIALAFSFVKGKFKNFIAKQRFE